VQRLTIGTRAARAGCGFLCPFHVGSEGDHRRNDGEKFSDLADVRFQPDFLLFCRYFFFITITLIFPSSTDDLVAARFYISPSIFVMGLLMKKTGFLYDERFLLHNTGPYHPETADRLAVIYSGLETSGLLSKLIRIEAGAAEMKWLELVHDKAYIERFQSVCHSGCDTFECEDNRLCFETYDIARLAVGGILEASRLVMEGVLDNAFCAVRPPGHHAEIGQAMGFCYFNNIAIAARYIQSQWGIKRIGIMDFDVHHGNGTQNIFERDPSVFYYSIHEHPSFAFPGTGRLFEKGIAEGIGFTRNYPVLPGQGDAEYKYIMDTDFIPLFDEFAPEVLLVSAGFDAHKDDEMADINLSTEGFSYIMERIVETADKHAGGRIISILEGGYSLKRLPELINNHVEILLRE
jgi:acetoin utilization deacetylase AcuC-like enzyme